MQPYVLDLIHGNDIILWQRISHAVKHLPDKIDLGKDEAGEKVILSCHILAKAVANVFKEKKVQCIDGRLYPNFFHSWIKTPYNNIIDVYPVATLGGPIIIHGGSGSQVKWHYLSLPKDGRVELDALFEKHYFKLAVVKMTEILQAQL